MNGVSAVGVTSRTISKAKELSNDYQIEHVCNNVYELIEKCVVDALLVFVSADQIFSLTEELIPQQIPLFIEKPPGLVPEETKILVELTEKFGTKAMVGFNRRYYSIFHKGLDVIDKHGPLLGVSIEGHERFWKIVNNSLPDAVKENWIYANSTHTIDLLRLLGGEIKSIHTLSKRLKEKNGDQFVASMEFDSGAIGSYTSHWFSPGGWSATMYGENVTVKFNPLEKCIWIDTDFNEYEIDPDEMDVKYKPGFYRQMEAFVNLVKTGKMDWPSMNLQDAFETMLLAEKMSYA